MDGHYKDLLSLKLILWVYHLFEDLKLKNFVKKGEVLIELVPNE